MDSEQAHAGHKLTALLILIYPGQNVCNRLTAVITKDTRKTIFFYAF